MKAIILVPFRDKLNHKIVHTPGEVKDFDDDRVAALAARGLVKSVKEPEVEAAQPETEPKGRPEKSQSEAEASLPNEPNDNE